VVKLLGIKVPILLEQLSSKEAAVKNKLIGAGIFFLVLSGCAVVPPDFADDDYRPRERARSECVEQAHDQGYRRVDVQGVRGMGRGEWEVMMQGRDRTGRDTRLRCEYDARSRRARVARTDR
jgi:hypothetical protein